MSLKFKVHQNTRKGSKTEGKWYGRAIVSGTTTTDDLASDIESRCTVTKPDILAVISALEKSIGEAIRNGNRVVLDNFGSFKLGMRTKPADSEKEFGQSNIAGIHVIFHPETYLTAGRKHSNKLVEGCKVENAARLLGKKTDTDDGGSTSPSGGPTGGNTGGNTGGGSTSGGSSSDDNDDREF